MNKHNYKVRREVEQCILECGGIIFGGHVRDVVLHDSHAVEYYSAGIVDSTVNFHDPIYYDDPHFYAELSGRTLISSDIDCYMDEKYLDCLISMLAQKKLCVSRVFIRNNAKEYLPRLQVPDDILKHARYRVTSFRSSISREIRKAIETTIHKDLRKIVKPTIDSFLQTLSDTLVDIKPFTIDILTTTSENFHKYFPPFGNLDFECNALILTKAGIQLSPMFMTHAHILSRMDKLNLIIYDIRNKEAKYVDGENVDSYRISKMIKKGWNVRFKSVQKVNACIYEKCIICHEDLQFNNHYKLPCCNARYHRQCLIDAFEKGDCAMSKTLRCIMCKKYTTAFYDIPLLEYGL